MVDMMFDTAPLCKQPNDLNDELEAVTGVQDPLSLRGLFPIPYFGYDPNIRDRLATLLELEGVTLDQLSLCRAIDFLMPSTTDFCRTWVGERVAALVKAPDPKIVTLGCSTGLEVYWIAHFLRQRGLLSDAGRVMGVDVNASALRIAASGKYDKTFFDASFRRSGPVEALSINETNRTVEFNDALKNSVRFGHANFLDLDALRGLGLADLDIVVLMNVLKYLNPQAQNTVLSNAATVLRKGGLLFTDISTLEIVETHPAFQATANGDDVFQRV